MVPTTGHQPHGLKKAEPLNGTGLSRHSAATAERAIPRCLQQFRPRHSENRFRNAEATASASARVGMTTEIVADGPTAAPVSETT